LNITIIFKYLGRHIYFMKNATVTMRKAPFSYRASDWIYNRRLQISAIAGPVLNFTGLIALVLAEGMVPGQAKNLAVSGSVAVEVGSLVLMGYALGEYHTRLNMANERLRQYKRNERIGVGNSGVGS